MYQHSTYVPINNQDEQQFEKSPIESVTFILNLIHPYLKLSVAFLRLSYPFYRLFHSMKVNVMFNWINECVCSDLFFDFLGVYYLAVNDTVDFTLIQRVIFCIYLILPMIYLCLYLTRKKRDVITHNVCLKIGIVLILICLGVYSTKFSTTIHPPRLWQFIPSFLKILTGILILFIARDVENHEEKLK